jgi:hypothetical protein
MLVKIDYLVKLFGYGTNVIRNIVDRGEFAKYRTGGTGGIFFDLNDKSKKLLLKFLATKKRRGKSGNTKRDSIERVEEKTVDEY